MKKLLTVIGAALGFAATINAAEVNLRDWLVAKGVDVASCVSGAAYHSDYGPVKLFDGVGTGGVYNSSYRWLAGEKSLAGAYVTIEIPKSAISTAKKELVLKRFRLWRSMNSGSNTGLQRAPLTWIVSGSNDGIGWTVLHNQSTTATWSNSTYSNEVALAENTEPFRYIKFEPKTSNYAYDWKVGLQEIEYFVEEVPQKPGVNLRDWLTGKGAIVADCVSGDGHNSSYGPTILFDGTNSVSNTTDAKNNRWLAKKNAGDTAYATISAPDEWFASDADGLVLRRYRIYRNSDLNDAHYLRRAPATWRVLGYDSKKDTWEVIDDRSSVAADWLEPGIGKKAYVEFEVPAAGRTPYRKFMFEPLESGIEFHETTTSLEWRIGAMEIEYFVEEAHAAANLRTYLEDKGVTVTNCVSGTGYNDSYKPEKLFDGKGMNNDKVATERWLAGENDITTASATIEIPSSALPVGKKGLAVKKIRLWRCIDIYYNNDGLYRAPQTWVFYGSNTGNDGDWTEIQRQSEPVAWNKDMLSFDVALPDNDTPFRFLKFLPLSSKYTAGTYKVGLRELEYFVAEVEPDTVIVCGSLGDDVGDSSHGYGRVNGVSADDTLTITAKTPSYANGVKYEATSYTLETSTDGGITWGAATSHNGTSATIAYNGTPTRLTWQWSPVAYRLDAHADEGNETVTVSPASADGYYAAGTALTVTAAGATSPTVTTFKEWDVQPEGAVANGATIGFTMPAAPTEVNASFTRPWTYVAAGAISNYPDYDEYAAVTDGNWLFVVASRKANDVSAEQYFCLNAYVKGSGRLDLATLHTDLETEGTRLYPLSGVNATAMYKPPELYASWNDGRGKLSSVAVPADILDVESSAFGSCSNLVSATLEGNLEKWNILTGGATGAFNDCPALERVELPSATALPHHIFSGSAPEVIFAGVPPTTIGTGWANDWNLAVGCPRRSLGAWRADSRFTALGNIENVASKPNYAEMSAKYGKDLIGAWDNKWLFRYGNPSGMVIILK